VLILLLGRFFWRVDRGMGSCGRAEFLGLLEPGVVVEEEVGIWVWHFHFGVGRVARVGGRHGWRGKRDYWIGGWAVRGFG